MCNYFSLVLVDPGRLEIDLMSSNPQSIADPHSSSELCTYTHVHTCIHVHVHVYLLYIDMTDGTSFVVYFILIQM